MTIDELALRLDQFAYDFDPYGYMDSIEDRQTGYDQIKEDLLNSDIKGIQSYLQEAVEEMEPDDEMQEEASSLLKELESYDHAACRESVLGSLRQAEEMNHNRRPEIVKATVEAER